MLRIPKLRLRYAALLSALAFLGASAVDASGLHGCSQHDALPEEAAPHTAPVDEHVAHDQHAEGHAQDSSHGAGHAGPCICIGACGVGTTMQGAKTLAGGTELSVPPVRAEAPHLPADDALPVPPRFFLPYALGPPLSA